MLVVFAAPLLLGPAVLGQIGYPPGGYPPGQYPPGQYPPGQYPGGQYPGGGGGIPIPGRGRSSSKTTEKSAPTKTTEGTLRKIDEKGLVMEAEDHRILTYKLTDKTKFVHEAKDIKSAELGPGDKLRVDSTQDSDGYFFAVNVELVKAAPKQTAAAGGNDPKGQDDDARGPATVNGPVPRDPNEEPPHLKRGIPAKRPTQDQVEIAANTRPVDTPPPPPRTARTPAPAAAPPPPPDEEHESSVVENRPAEQPAGVPVDSPVEKAREAAFSFTETLPNYVCQQFTTRYMSNARPVSWVAQDVVSAEVVYEGGKEEYRNLAINGKPTKKPMEELPGSWSKGEFGTVLDDLLSPATQAEFHFQHEESVQHRTALMYKYTVARENSHWQVTVAAQTVLPAYNGAVWIDKKTSRVLRIEMEARKIPGEFPLDTVESAVDYDFVRLGAAEFLLPVHGEILSCERGSLACSRNTLDFRNCHKFTGETNITFGETK